MTGITNILTTAFLLKIVMALELFLNLHENVGFEFKLNQTRNTFENTIGWLIFFNSLKNGTLGQCLHDGSNLISVEGILHIVLSFLFLFLFLLLFQFNSFLESNPIL